MQCEKERKRCDKSIDKLKHVRCRHREFGAALRVIYRKYSTQIRFNFVYLASYFGGAEPKFHIENREQSTFCTFAIKCLAQHSTSKQIINYIFIRCNGFVWLKIFRAFVFFFFTATSRSVQIYANQIKLSVIDVEVMNKWL